MIKRIKMTIQMNHRMKKVRMTTQIGQTKIQMQNHSMILYVQMAAVKIYSIKQLNFVLDVAKLKMKCKILKRTRICSGTELKKVCHLRGSNTGPSDLQSDALPAELKRLRKAELESSILNSILKKRK